MLKQKVFDAITSVLGTNKVVILKPKLPELGDYAINIHQLDQKIDALSFENDSLLFEKVEQKGTFINFFMKKELLGEELKEILLKKDFYGNLEILKDKKIMVEFTDPNPFKEFHIGHLFTNTIGESLVRIFEKAGATVKRANYQGDVGMHVAKSVWGMMKMQSEMPKENESLSAKAQYLGKAYALGSTKFEDDEMIKKEIEIINKKIYDKDPSLFDLYLKGRSWSLEYFETIYKKLGTKFDYYYFESIMGPIGLALVEEYLTKGVFEKSQGAVIFPGEKENLHTRVFINSLGLPTYEAKELALAPTKFKDFPYDTSYIITANEINSYFKVLLAALGKIYPELAAKTIHLSHGFVRLPEGKMSSRTGNIISGEELIEMAQNEIKKILEEGKKYNEEEIEHISLQVAIAAIKYTFLKSSLGRDVIFDMKTSISFTGDSGPYLQYTYARSQSILKKIDASDYAFSLGKTASLQKEELALLKIFTTYPEIIAESINHTSPHLLCLYLHSLAQSFNNFYEALPVIKAQGDAKALRIALVKATSIILASGLHLLGIEAPERI